MSASQTPSASTVTFKGKSPAVNIDGLQSRGPDDVLTGVAGARQMRRFPLAIVCNQAKFVSGKSSATIAPFTLSAVMSGTGLAPSALTIWNGALEAKRPRIRSSPSTSSATLMW
jgi:hypothetical protein